MLVRTGRVATGAVPTATIVVVGGDTVVGHALKLLLRGSGYDARFEALSAFDAEVTLRGADLVLLAPCLDERGGGKVVASAASRGGGLPVVELVPATKPRPGGGHAFLPWPCRTEDLEREIESSLGASLWASQRGRGAAEVASDQGPRPRG